MSGRLPETANWNDIPDVIKMKIICKMNKPWKELHYEKISKFSEIRARRKDYACMGCTRIAMFSTGKLSRKPSTRMFAVRIDGSTSMRVFGECKQHLTKETFDENKSVIPREYDHDHNTIRKYICHKFKDVDNVIIHRGMDELDLDIRRSISEGNIFATYEHRRRPIWCKLQILKK